MKVIEVLNNLSKVERNRLKKFLGSPYFNVNDSIFEIFLSIDDMLRDENQITKEEIWARSFEGQDYNDLKWRKLTSDLNNLILDFFAFESLKTNEHLKANLLLEYLYENELSSTVPTAIKKGTNLFSNDKKNNNLFHLNRYVFHKHTFDSISDAQIKKLKSDVPLGIDDLNQINDDLDLFYLSSKLQTACSFLNYQAFSTTTQQISYEDYVLQMVNDKELQNPYLYLYYKSYLLYKDEISLEEVRTVLENIEKYISQLSSREVQEIYGHWINVTIRKVNKGETLYNEILFDLFKIGLRYELLLVNNYLNTSVYRNIALTASRLNEFEWALNFADEYKSSLEPLHRETAYSFNKARIFRQMKKYDQVIDILRNVEYEDITYNLNSKLMLMISYYELEELTVLDSFIKSFKVFLRRQRNIPKARKEAFYGFTTILSHIIKAVERFDAKRLSAARTELESNPSIPNKAWLLEKIVAVEKRLKVKNTEVS